MNRAHFFARNAPNAHKALSTTRFLRACRDRIRAVRRAAPRDRRGIFLTARATSERPFSGLLRAPKSARVEHLPARGKVRGRALRHAAFPGRANTARARVKNCRRSAGGTPQRRQRARCQHAIDDAAQAACASRRAAKKICNALIHQEKIFRRCFLSAPFARARVRANVRKCARGACGQRRRGALARAGQTRPRASRAPFRRRLQRFQAPQSAHGLRRFPTPRTRRMGPFSSRENALQVKSRNAASARKIRRKKARHWQNLSARAARARAICATRNRRAGR
jgi:hypothetical protein